LSELNVGNSSWKLNLRDIPFVGEGLVPVRLALKYDVIKVPLTSRLF